MKICLIQLTRIGDIIQTYRAANQLKIEKPNIELTLITRKKFSNQLNFLLKTVFKDIIEIDTKQFFDKEKPNLKSSKLKLHNFIHDIKKNDFDLVINLSFNKSSSYLTTLLSSTAKVKMGLYRNDTAQIGINDKWSQYIYSNVMESTHCPFNLVDIYRSILGAREIDLTNFQTPQNKQITIHPFASSRKKAWPMHKWIELIQDLLGNDQDIEINIVGAKSDTDMAQRIIDSPVLKIFNKRIRNFVGINTIEDTFNLLSESHLFIGHDSMVSHLAGLFRMPSLILSLGTVRAHETTPYNDKVVNLVPRNNCYPCKPNKSCELLPCHNSLNTLVVSSIASNMLKTKTYNKESILSGLTSESTGSVNIYTSAFDNGGLYLTEVNARANTSSDIFKIFYRLLWSYYFNNIEISTDIPAISEDQSTFFHQQLEGTKHLFELYNHGFQFCNQILDESEKESPSVKTIQDKVAQLAEIDELTTITKDAYPLLAPIADFFFVNKANAAGENIIEITNNNLIAFHEATNITAILNDLLNKTVGPKISGSGISKEV